MANRKRKIISETERDKVMGEYPAIGRGCHRGDPLQGKTGI